MDPKVECTGDSMKLQVQDAASTLGSLFFVDRGGLLRSPVALVRVTREDVMPFDEAVFTQPSDGHLPRSGHGRENGMDMTGNWEPLMKASPRCGFSVVVHPEGVVISVRYAPCLEKKDGIHKLLLQDLHNLLPAGAEYSSPSIPSTSTLSQCLKSQLLLQGPHNLKRLSQSLKSQLLRQGLHSLKRLSQSLKSQLLLQDLHSLKPLGAKYSSPSTPSTSTLSQGLKSQVQLQDLHNLKHLSQSPKSQQLLQDLHSVLHLGVRYSSPSTPSTSTLSQSLKSQLLLQGPHNLKRQSLKSRLLLQDLHSLKPLGAKYSSPSTLSTSTLSQGLKSQVQLQDLHNLKHLSQSPKSQQLLQDLHSVLHLGARYSSPSTPSTSTLSQSLKSQLLLQGPHNLKRQSLKSRLLLQDLHSLKSLGAKYSSPSTLSTSTLSQSLKSQLLPQGLHNLKHLSQSLKSQLLLQDLHSLLLLGAKYSSPSTPSTSTLIHCLKIQLLLQDLHSLKCLSHSLKSQLLLQDLHSLKCLSQSLKSHLLLQDLHSLLLHLCTALRFAHLDFLIAVHKLLFINISIKLFLLDLLVKMHLQSIQDCHSSLHLHILGLAMAWVLLPFHKGQLKQ
ncbi:uncharacterized protein LOC119499192 [Sebastes umbrosus]|uniref:uncharacterized protein LOC119499192 n=1 Tax=Sebastes umbrosus TaxID=72105 RepID=UPI0018A0F463|nr:uncharacterized protein LOC119499192 [Sebastes umbrosus]